jgi:DNA-3-methyladenine glycosylase II
MRVNPVTFPLDYSPPLDWPFILRYLQARATPGVEWVDEGRYSRTISVGRAMGHLEVADQASKKRLVVTVHGAVRDHATLISERVARMFDLRTDMSMVHSVLGADRWLAPLVRAHPGLRVPGSWSAFELIVRAIVGQQVSVKAASTIMGRIARRLGSRVEGAGRGEASLSFPRPRAIAEGDLDQIGMPSKRVAAVRGVARAVADGAIPFSDDGTVADGVKQALLGLPGIGPWTAEYFALRALRDGDAWPGSDLVLARSLAALMPEGTASERLAISERWRPWRAYAAIHLWNKASQGESQR